MVLTLFCKTLKAAVDNESMGSETFNWSSERVYERVNNWLDTNGYLYINK